MRKSKVTRKVQINNKKMMKKYSERFLPYMVDAIENNMLKAGVVNNEREKLVSDEELAMYLSTLYADVYSQMANGAGKAEFVKAMIYIANFYKITDKVTQLLEEAEIEVKEETTENKEVKED